ncbi:MAG: hypothetical protein H8D31_05175 [Nitrosopumilus sp.]|nr:hypothetical protein [Nitrosopumilus sp.]
MNNFAVKELYSDKHTSLPSVSSLLKISLGLILFTMLSTALVYAETMSVDVEGTSFDVEYTATGFTVDDVESDSGFGSLLFTVDVTDSIGILNLVLERSFLDSTFEGEDDPFIIINQFGEDLVFTETTTSLSRTLNIELPAGTIEVDVIGTSFNNSILSEPVEPPVVETPTVEPPVVETPTVEPPVVETPTVEPPVVETPTVEPPVVETPTVEPPVVETPTVEPPVDNTPKIQCGPGTVLKDGACVLDERCGPGTVLKDGACVLDSTSQSSGSSKGMGKESLMGFVVAFVIAGIVAVIFGIIARASKSSN